jgi:hypothetical protein
LCALALKLKNKINKTDETVTKKDWIVVRHPHCVFSV